MKEIRGIIAEYDKPDKVGQPVALATVFEVKGSSYRRSGARMLISDDGNWFGGISGGCIEGNALKQAHLVSSDGRARLVTYDTSNDDEASIGVSLGCNGVISVLIAPIGNNLNYNPIDKLREVIDTRDPTVLITVLDSDITELPAGSVLSADEIEALQLPQLTSLQDKINEVLENGKSLVVNAGNSRLFLEFIEPETNLIIMGGNYDIMPVLQLAEILGWHKTVITNPKRLYPPAKQYIDQVIENFDDAIIDEHSVTIIMSHDYQADLDNLRKSLTTDLEYIGLLGPAVRRDDMLNELKQEGLIIDKKRIFGPAGLDIGALQPEEIALAILAEIIAVKRRRTAQSLRNRQVPIHEREINSSAELI
jgi:xanthine dehydrogenase accessory factor